MNKPIFVTSPSLPALNDFIPYLKKIWDNKWLTNNGEFHKKFEAALAGEAETAVLLDGRPVALEALRTESGGVEMPPGWKRYDR